MVTKPDVLLLDEPINHLDITSITWMEKIEIELAASYDRWEELENIKEAAS